MNQQELRAAYESGAMDKGGYLQEMGRYYRILLGFADLVRGSAISGISLREDGALFEFRDPPMRMWGTQELRQPAWEAVMFRGYEDFELRTITNLLDNSGVLVDIGANAGYWSLYLSARFPAAHIIAFEPIPGTIDILRRNIGLNGTANVEAIPMGLSDSAGILTFYVDPAHTGAATCAQLQHPEPGSVATRCPVSTLDAVLEERDDEVQFIKCDVEGAELNVLRGALRTIEKYRPTIFAELLRKWSARFGYHPNAVIDLLSDRGYQCFAFERGRLERCSSITDQTVSTNFLFVARQAHLERMGRSA